MKSPSARDGAAEDSFEQFAERGAARLLRTAYLLTGDRNAVEDLLQATLMRTALQWERARDAPDAYAYRVLVNLVHDRRRRLGRRVRETDLDPNAIAVYNQADPADAILDREVMLSAVKLLPARQREVLALRFYAGLSVSETAAAMGTSEGSVKTHTSRALAKLREVLEDAAASGEKREV